MLNRILPKKLYSIRSSKIINDIGNRNKKFIRLDEELYYKDLDDDIKEEIFNKQLEILKIINNCKKQCDIKNNNNINNKIKDNNKSKEYDSLNDRIRDIY
tara:strand:- start:68 stop:367 length:300 start_codon:yes stop_codon:yes gene_type:complete